MKRELEVINKETGKLEKITLRFLNEEDLDFVMRLQEKVIEWLPNKELYFPSTREEFKRFIEKMGNIIGGVTKDGEVIAMGVYCKLGLDDENYGYDIGIEGEELLKVCQIESTIVHKAYRGNKLQLKICTEIEKLASKDEMHIIMATVSPMNPHSLNSFLERKYKIEKEKIKYGGLKRCILSKKL